MRNEEETEIKKYSKLNNALLFLDIQDLRARHLLSLYYRIVSTMLFYRNYTTVLLFLSSMRTSRPWPYPSLFSKCLMAALKRKAVVKIGMQCETLLADARF